MIDKDRWKDRQEVIQLKSRLGGIRKIIQLVDNRAMAADGSTPTTMQEMTNEEISDIYKLAAGNKSSNAMGVSKDLHTQFDWNEDIGPVLWTRWPIVELPYCGTPLDSDWPWQNPTDVKVIDLFWAFLPNVFRTALACDHPWHSNQGLITPCPQCFTGRD